MKINLEEILNKVIGIETKSDSFKLAILEAMKEACNQAIDETVKRCANQFKSSIYQETEELEIVSNRAKYLVENSGIIDSVLQVANQLKKELE